MDDFNAESANKISKSIGTPSLFNVLVSIKMAAKNGNKFLHIYEYLEEKVIDKLIDRGFEISKMNSISIQKDNLYYTIRW